MFTFENLKNNHDLIIKITHDIINNQKRLCFDKSPLKLLDFCAKITGQIICKSFFSNDIENIKVNNKPIEIGIVEIFADSMKIRRSLFYTLKE